MKWATLFHDLENPFPIYQCWPFDKMSLKALIFVERNYLENPSLDERAKKVRTFITPSVVRGPITFGHNNHSVMWV